MLQQSLWRGISRVIEGEKFDTKEIERVSKNIERVESVITRPTPPSSGVSLDLRISDPRSSSTYLK